MNNTDIVIKYLESDPDKDVKSWKSHSLSYSKGILYSYSTPIAVMLRWKGKEYLVLSTTSYSCTTSRHRSELLGQAWRKYPKENIIHIERLSKWLNTNTSDRSELIDWAAYKADLVEYVEDHLKSDPLDYASSWRRDSVTHILAFLHTISRFINVTKEIAQLHKIYLTFDTVDKINDLIAARKKKDREDAKKEKDERINLILTTPELAWVVYLSSDSSLYLKDEVRCKLKKPYSDFVDKIMFNRGEFVRNMQSVIGYSIEFQRSYGGRGLADVSLTSYRGSTRIFDVNLCDLVNAYNPETNDFLDTFQAKFGQGYSYRSDMTDCTFIKGQFDWTITARGNSRDPYYSMRYHIPRELMDFFVPLCKHIKEHLDKGDFKNATR